MLVAVPELGPRLACAPCDDDGSNAPEVAEEGTPQVGRCYVATEDMDFVEPKDIADCRRPLHAGAGEESRGFEALSHEGGSCAELDEGVRPLEFRLVWSPVGVDHPLELGRMSPRHDLPLGEEDHGTGWKIREFEEVGLA